MANKIIISTAPLARFENKLPYGFLSTFKAMERILARNVVDGFGLLYKPEWDEDPPLSQKDMFDCGAKEVLSRLQNSCFPILSVHARKDIGVYLCSKQTDCFEKGKRLVYDALAFAEALGAEVCVFHLWDTFSTGFDINSISNAFQESISQFPRLRASVENIPTCIEGKTPFDLIGNFRYLTLDTRWAVVYNDLDSFKKTGDKIVNIHLRGELRGDNWFLDNSRYDFCGILEKIRRHWNYLRLLTMEPDGTLESSRFDGFLKAMLSLKRDAFTL